MVSQAGPPGQRRSGVRRQQRRPRGGGACSVLPAAIALAAAATTTTTTTCCLASAVVVPGAQGSAGSAAAASASSAFVAPRYQPLHALSTRGGANGPLVAPGALIAPLPAAAPGPGAGAGGPGARQRGALDARLSFRVTSRRLFNKLGGAVRSSWTALGMERGRSSELPHDEVTFRRRGPDSAELTSIPQPERYSSGDWMHNIMNLPGSQVLQRIRVPIVANMLWALAVSFLFKFFNWQPIPSRVHTLLGSSLGLLLVFRTNASYSRYWEGRQLWDRLHSKARDLARAVSIYEDCLGSERVTAVGRLICAYPLVMREHLTGENHKPELARLLGPQLSDTLDASSNNKPLWLCNRLSAVFRAIPEQGTNFSSRERLMLLGLVNDLSAVLGGCERLVQTPVPLSYARHTSRFLTLYLWSLPMVLVADFTGPWLALVSGFVCWCLFGILEIGLLIEDPFQRLLRSSWTGVISDAIARDVQWNLAENRRITGSKIQGAAAGAGPGVVPSPSSSSGLPY